MVESLLYVLVIHYIVPDHVRGQIFSGSIELTDQ
jgi:hypothetical protein